MLRAKQGKSGLGGTMGPFRRDNGEGQVPNGTPMCVVQQKVLDGYQPDPWVEMPPGGLPFDPFGTIVTPAANSVETLVLQFRIPYQYDGIILGVTNLFTGPGFVEGSGDLVWRIRVGQPNLLGRPQRNYENILQTMGDLGDPRTVQGGIVVTSNQFVEYSVTHTIGSPIVPAGTRIICNVQGFYWPRGSSVRSAGGRA